MWHGLCSSLWVLSSRRVTAVSKRHGRAQEVTVQGARSQCRQRHKAAETGQHAHRCVLNHSLLENLLIMKTGRYGLPATSLKSSSNDHKSPFTSLMSTQDRRWWEGPGHGGTLKECQGDRDHSGMKDSKFSESWEGQRVLFDAAWYSPHFIQEMWTTLLHDWKTEFLKKLSKSPLTKRSDFQVRGYTNATQTRPLSMSPWPLFLSDCSILLSSPG